MRRHQARALSDFKSVAGRCTKHKHLPAFLRGCETFETLRFLGARGVPLGRGGLIGVTTFKGRGTRGRSRLTTTLVSCGDVSLGQRNQQAINRGRFCTKNQPVSTEQERVLAFILFLTRLDGARLLRASDGAEIVQVISCSTVVKNTKMLQKTSYLCTRLCRFCYGHDQVRVSSWQARWHPRQAVSRCLRPPSL